MTKERIRETLDDEFNFETIERKQREGWRAVAIEWEREAPGKPELVREQEEIPYGARASSHVDAA